MPELSTLGMEHSSKITSASKRGRHRAVREALRTFAKSPYGELVGGRLTTEMRRQNAIDFLADLRHFCDVEEFDFGELDRIACGHYRQEL